MDTTEPTIRPHRPRRLLAALGLAAAVLTAAACSSSSREASTAKAPTSHEQADAPAPKGKQAATLRAACDVLTPALAAQVVPGAGKPTSDRNTVDAVTVSNCRYRAADGSSLSLLARHEPGQGTFVDSSIDTLKTVTYDGVDTADVSGIGDAALFAASSGGQLNVFDGDDFFVFTGGSLEQLSGVARAALSA